MITRTIAGEQIDQLRSVVERLRLESLNAPLAACEALRDGSDSPLDVAVFGQFKSGKSSLLNSLLGGPVLPVGVLPVTAIVTRMTAGAQLAARVTRDDGAIEAIDPANIGDYVSESRNPNNYRHISLVDFLTPQLADLPNIRLVDTPGLGSVLAHNTQSTHNWLPNVAMALVAVSVERPLSDEDRRLIAELRPHAPRIWVVLTKVDLLTDAQRAEVREFVAGRLAEDGSADVPVLFFSTREQPEHWASRLKDVILRPIAADARGERDRTLSHKVDSLTTACLGYLSVALEAAERTEADRQRLAAAVFDESTNEAVLRDELELTAARSIQRCRPAFETAVLSTRDEIQRRLAGALTAEMRSWQGHLATQTARYQSWLELHLTAEINPISQSATPLAGDLVAQAESRLRRIAGAFSDRLRRNVTQATGVTLSPVAWEARRPPFLAAPIRISPAFLTHWELLWWLLPMPLVGGVFRRHCVGRVPWELEKNLLRLSSDLTEATSAAIEDLKRQAIHWAQDELATLMRILACPAADAEEIREALARLSAAEPAQ
jgi:GTP-binding protein EngB required for normal cell division